MQSKSATVAEYLASLPADRRDAISAVRDVILANLDEGYEEGMSYGMIGYAVPHSVYPPGYHCDPKLPLPFAGLGSQKGHMSLHLMGLHGHAEREAWFRKAFAAAGKKLDMGKACVRFKRAEDLPLAVIGEAIKRVPSKVYIKFYEETIRPAEKQKKQVAKPAVKQVAKKTAKKAAKKAGKKAAKKVASKR